MSKEQELIKQYKLLVDRIYYLTGKELVAKCDLIDALQRKLGESDADIQESSTSTDDTTGE